MNLRQLRLKNMIDSDNIPTVIDASIIYNPDESKIPFHWGDLEAIGYGKTSRYYSKMYDEMIVTRYYNGPGKIKLNPGGIMAKGDCNED